MGDLSPVEITRLLRDWSRGERAALDQLMPVVHDELRRVAARVLRGERSGHTLQATALVNDAYLKLVDQRHVRWEDRAHFFAVGAQVMRRILIDHARRHAAAKRGGGIATLTLDGAATTAPAPHIDLLALHVASSALPPSTRGRSASSSCGSSVG